MLSKVVALFHPYIILQTDQYNELQIYQVDNGHTWNWFLLFTPLWTTNLLLLVPAIYETVLVSLHIVETVLVYIILVSGSCAKSEDRELTR